MKFVLLQLYLFISSEFTRRRGMNNDMFWFDKGLGFGVPGDTPARRTPRNNPTLPYPTRAARTRTIYERILIVQLSRGKTTEITVI